MYAKGLSMRMYEKEDGPCKCGFVGDYYDHECLFVHCDDANCRARREPRTESEAFEALDHWKNHSLMCGCSHGC